MSNIEEDYKLFQLVKRNPINSCKDLSKNMIGKKRGIFYFTELFRIDFENKMSDFERLKEEREQDKKRIEELEDRCKEHQVLLVSANNDLENSIPVQKVKDKIEELKDEKNKRIKYGIFILKDYDNQRLLGEISSLEELLEDK